MKTVKRNLIAITVTGVLTGSALAALADTGKDRPFEGVVVDDVVVVEQFPSEVQTGSMQMVEDSESAMAAKAGIDVKEAADIARRALPGTVVQARLDRENGYLIWEVEVIGNEAQEARLKIDAGNGRLLAMEAGKDGERHHAEREEHKHSSWKFWEDDDRPEGREERD